MDPSKKITPIQKDLVKEFQSKLKITRKSSKDVVKPGTLALQSVFEPEIPSRKPIIKEPIGAIDSSKSKPNLPPKPIKPRNHS